MKRAEKSIKWEREELESDKQQVTESARFCANIYSKLEQIITKKKNIKQNGKNL